MAAAHWLRELTLFLRPIGKKGADRIANLIRVTRAQASLRAHDATVAAVRAGCCSSMQPGLDMIFDIPVWCESPAGVRLET